MIAQDILKKKYPQVDQEDTISKLVGQMKKFQIGSALVFSDKKFKAIADRRSLVRARANTSEMKVKRIMRKCPKLGKGDNAKKIASQLITDGSRILPVFDKNILLGIVNDIDVLNAVENKKLNAEQIAKNSKALLYSDQIGKAVNIMHLSKIDHLPIVDEQNNLIGMCSLMDILSKFLAFPAMKSGGFGRRMPLSHPGKEQDMLKLPIRNVMSKNVATVKPNDAISKVINLMQRRNISSVVVAEKYEIVGLITIKDLLKLIK